MKNVGFNLQEASKEERKVLKAGNIISEETEEEEDTHRETENIEKEEASEYASIRNIKMQKKMPKDYEII